MKKSMILVVTALVVLYACQRQVCSPNNQPDALVISSEMQDNINNAKAEPVCFEAEVLPIFQSSCAKSGCHDVTTHEEGYVLDSYQHIMKKGIKPGEPFDSELFEVILSG